MLNWKGKKDKVNTLLWLAYGISFLKLAFVFPALRTTLHQKSMEPHRHLLEVFFETLIVASYTIFAFLVLNITKKKNWAYILYTLIFLFNTFNLFSDVETQPAGETDLEALTYFLEFIAIAILFPHFFVNIVQNTSTGKARVSFFERRGRSPIGFFFGVCALLSLRYFPNNKYLSGFLHFFEIFGLLALVVAAAWVVRQRAKRSKNHS
jgi:hypothetical protein